MRPPTSGIGRHISVAHYYGPRKREAHILERRRSFFCAGGVSCSTDRAMRRILPWLSAIRAQDKGLLDAVVGLFAADAEVVFNVDACIAIASEQAGAERG